jgi:BirA family biotin operon repressor/biotin-[acetyl-CoA-carboxylase] ligase
VGASPAKQHVNRTGSRDEQGNFVTVCNGSQLPRLNAVVLQNELPQAWRQLELVEETGSTNSDLLTRAAAGEEIDGIVLIAEHQTAGRGRTGRSWLSSPHSQITMSLGVSAAGVAADGWGWLPLATGVAVVDALAPLTGTSIGLKWPNDVLAGEGKLAGILAEVGSPKPTIVVGIGINVVGHPDEAAVALADLGVATNDRNELIPPLLHELGARIERWRAAGGADDRLIAPASALETLDRAGAGAGDRHRFGGIRRRGRRADDLGPDRQDRRLRRDRRDLAADHRVADIVAILELVHNAFRHHRSARDVPPRATHPQRHRHSAGPYQQC